MNFNKIAFTGIAALLISSTGFAQVKKKPTPSPKSKPVTTIASAKPAALPVDPEVIIGKLPNGLTYYIRANALPKSRASLFLVNKAGSLLESDAQQGAAHFIQHMAFNGTRDFPKAELTNYLKARGGNYGPDISSSSSFDQSTYQLTLPTDTIDIFEKGFKILANWAGNINFDAADIEKERVIAIAEANASTNAQQRLQNQSIPILLKNSRYALRQPAGNEAAIKKLDAASIKAFYKDWYRPNLQSLIIVGDFDVKSVEKLIKDNFSSLTNPSPSKPAAEYTVASAPGTNVNFITDKVIVYPQMQIVSIQPPTQIKTVADYLQNIRVSLFNQMLDARINELVNQRNSPLTSGSASYTPFIGKQNAFTINVGSKPGEFELAVKAIMAEIESVKKFGFTVTELERAKQNSLIGYSNAYQNKARALSVGYVSQYIQNFIYGEPITGVDYEYNVYTNNITKISIADINAVAAKYMNLPNRVILVQGPEADKSNIPTEATLLAWINDAGKNITAYVDEKDEPILDKLPDAGKVVKTEQDSSIIVTRLTLSNGVKVILKPTDFANDQILISGYSFGGTSLASDADLVSAKLADQIIPVSGIGNITQTQLFKRLNGKKANISPYISEFTQGISGSTNTEDFEMAMQLLYLYFTQPRKDATTWQEEIKQQKAAVMKKAIDPLSAYQDTASAILTNHNPRVKSFTITDLEKASLDKAYQFYKDRFADASGFTFTFVGSFDVKSITPYLEAYLGSLPSTNKNETYKNWKVYPQPGKVNKTISKGTNEKASVQLTYSGSYDYNEDNNLQMAALEEAINMKLGARLTEEEGAFAPGASVNYTKIPEGRYEITVYFDATPANVDKLINVAFEEINKLKANGADDKEIKNFTLKEAQQTKANFRQNIFWAGYLNSTSQNQEDPAKLISYVQSLSKVTAQSTKEAANKYFSDTNLIKLVLLPEKK
ncbi:MAG: insulinase family protein [Sphingobacteriaceae bacterium]|nr:MAG: insulinase family protein [Sphingobacteriaceae bacterium]